LIRLPTSPQRWNVSPLQYGQSDGLSSFSRFTWGSCNTIRIEGSLEMFSLITTFYKEPSLLSNPTNFVTVTRNVFVTRPVGESGKKKRQRIAYFYP
jgi:hypothetical protein